MSMIDHIALYVENLESAKAFFETYFSAEAGSKYHNPNTGLETYFLSFQGSETRLELMYRPDIPSCENSQVPQAGYAHLAFRLGGRQAVDSLTERLKTDGYSIVSGPRVTGDGYYESCVLDAEGNQIELVE